MNDSNESSAELPPPAEVDIIARLRYSLARSIFTLRVLGFVGLLGTVANLILLIVSVVAQSRVIYIEDYSDNYILANVITGALVIMVLGLRDISRKWSEALFQEMSEQLQDFVGFSSSPENDGNRDESGFRLLYMQARRTLREAASVVDLPLVPGRYSSAIYAFINLLTVISSLAFYIALTPTASRFGL